MYFGLLEDFISTVLETAPELLTDSERVQLIIGLRAKSVLELCRNDTFTNQQAFQLHLNQFNSYITKQDKETSNPDVKAAVTNFLRLVHTLMEDQCQKHNFYQNIFPTVFGPKYDSALQALMKKFLFSLQELLPVPDFEQTSLWISLSPSIMKECVDLMSQIKPLKTLIQHHKHHGRAIAQTPSSCDDCILSSLSYDLGTEDDDKIDVVIKSEPICDAQEWQTVSLLSSESKPSQEEDVKVLHSESVRNVEEHEQCRGDDLTEDQGASVEVIVPSFEGNESNDDDEMDKKWFNHLKTDSGTSDDDCSLICKGSHQETTNSKCSTSLALLTKPHPLNIINKPSPLEMSKVEPPSISSDSLHDQAHERGSCVKQCSICGKVFPCSADLMRHTQCHPEQSPYLCSNCGPKELSKDSSTSSGNNRNQELTVISSKISETSMTANAPTALKACTTFLASSDCGQYFTHFKRFEEHQKTCSTSQLEEQISTNYVIINGCDFFSFNKTKENNAGQSSETKGSWTTTTPSSETSQTRTTADVPADSKACKPTLTCPECGQRFTYCKSFEKHLKKCSEEGSQTKQRTSTNHLIIKGCYASSVDNTCESHTQKRIESKTEATLSTTDNVEGSKQKAQDFKCTICEKNFSKIAVMKKHYSESHKVRGSYPCMMCKTSFLRLCDLVRHQQNKKLFLCPICNKGYRQPEEIERHKKVHSASVKPCKCEICGKSFTSHAPLIRHKRKHRERPPVICTYCGKQFSSKDYLKAHMVRHTEGYPCPVCGKIFYQKTYLKYHLYKHTGQEPYLCDTCGKGWPTAALLKVHMVKHREGRPLKCDDCGATYKRESSLISHKRSKHGGMRPFICEVCSKAFRIKSQLKNHMMVHTGERPYSCQHCGKKFSKGYNLKKHREKPCFLAKPDSELVSD
ncbi:zinc finger protein 665-like isoform X2 [Cheilinus undulatus]|nr:zinc finger protein 665-like isoform X2 [Cheilinus undulatus]